MPKGADAAAGNLNPPDTGRPDADSFGRADARLEAHNLALKNPEDLREATRGADLRIIQLATGGFEGLLTHAQVGGFSLSAGDFGPDIRARGVMNAELVTIGTMLDSSGEVSQWDYDVRPGDIIVFPKSVEQEGRYTGRSRYVTITLSEQELAAHVKTEGRLQESEFWTRIRRFQPSEAQRASMREYLARRVLQLREGKVPLSAAGIDFFRRSVLEAFVGCIAGEVQDDREEQYFRGARLVRDVEDYVDALRPGRPVHISELCSVLLVSRRKLHRAFQDTIGVGPMAYLRLRRLSAAHNALRSGRMAGGSVTQTALEYGFCDLGRFASYYRRIFDEAPSETIRSAQLRGVRPA
ncbi:AraC family transcriptional regulator [Mesorhizobium koreense]|uniref:AraC family transcriptional regulator n=1 Tax=Mesorhizobium koreense TaxID=3074855 RepID=UPI00287BB381|nr:helix-turn-helix transcriptional regulator [Mesorhizobium sp. WR6]